MPQVALSLGSNLGNRENFIRRMEHHLSGILLPPIKMSPLYETEALDMGAGTPAFLNKVIVGEYDSSPESLLKKIHQIEDKLGRKRISGIILSRTADIDILLFDNLILQTNELIIPHPGLCKRLFLLKALVQIVPEWKIPGIDKYPKSIIDEIDDSVKKQKLREVKESEN